MIEKLSDEDKLIFNQLAGKLSEVNGDISKLSKDEIDFISEMEAKYADKLSQFERLEIPGKENINRPSNSKVGGSKELLESGFAFHVRQTLARDLKSQFPNEEDAVKFAFQNKWIPQDFKELDTVQRLFDDYKQDICEANQWREEVVDVESDKVMAVGLTWFMVIFQLNQRLNGPANN